MGDAAAGGLGVSPPSGDSGSTAVTVGLAAGGPAGERDRGRITARAEDVPFAVGVRPAPHASFAAGDGSGGHRLQCEGATAAGSVIATPAPLAAAGGAAEGSAGPAVEKAAADPIEPLIARPAPLAAAGGPVRGRAAAVAARPLPKPKPAKCRACLGAHCAHTCAGKRKAAALPLDASCAACRGAHRAHTCIGRSLAASALVATTVKRPRVIGGCRACAGAHRAHTCHKSRQLTAGKQADAMAPATEEANDWSPGPRLGRPQSWRPEAQH